MWNQRKLIFYVVTSKVFTSTLQACFMQYVYSEIKYTKRQVFWSYIHHEPNLILPHRLVGYFDLQEVSVKTEFISVPFSAKVFHNLAHVFYSNTFFFPVH